MSLTSILGQGIVYSSLIIAVAGIEMNTKLVILTNVKNKESLRRAEQDLTDFISIAFFIVLGTSLLMHSQFGFKGVFINVGLSLITIWWLAHSYSKNLNRVKMQLAADGITDK